MEGAQLEVDSMSEVRGCPLCGGPPAPWADKRGHTIYECADCGHRFARPLADVDGHVTAVYGDHYFHGGADGYRDYLAEGELLRAHGRRYGELLSRHAAPGSVIDVGAAAGFLLQGLGDAGWRGVGVEPNAAMARHAREELGLDVRALPIERFEATDPVDAAVLVQVLPHVIDPVSVLERVVGWVRPGGLVLIETWNRSSLLARGFGIGWHEYNPPSVLHWFNPQSVRAVVGRLGAAEIATGTPAKYIAVGNAQSALQHAADGSRLWSVAAKALGALPPRWKLRYPAEDLAWQLFRVR
jgi:SAM-dependent methyltransferase